MEKRGFTTTPSEEEISDLVDIINLAALAKRTGIQLGDRYEIKIKDTQNARVIEFEDDDTLDPEVKAQIAAIKDMIEQKEANTIEGKLATVLKRIAELEALEAAENALKKKED